MRYRMFALTSIVLNSCLLSAFIVAARIDSSNLGKPVIITVGFASVTLLLWHALRDATHNNAVLVCPLLLALGYVIAFNVLGLLAFPSLLRDVAASLTDYLWSLVKVTGILFGLLFIESLFISTAVKYARTHKV
jgi:hypothetical protein